MTKTVSTVLVSGATGFLGSSLLRALLGAGHSVKALRRANSSLARIADVADQVEWLVIDSGLTSELTGFMSDVHCVIHTAASYGRKGESATDIMLTNTVFGLQILEAAITAGIKLFINTDTSLPRDSKPYTLSKAHLADWGKLLVAGKDMSFFNIRLEHMYGPGDDDIKFTSYVINACVNNLAQLDLTAGLQERDFIYIDDVTDAYLLLLDEGCKAIAGYRDIALGSGHTITIRGLVETIKLIAGSTTHLKFGAVATGANEIMFSCADMSEIARMGWQPKIDLETGLRRTIAQVQGEMQQCSQQAFPTA